MKSHALPQSRRGGLIKKLLFTVVFLAAAAVLAWILFLPALVKSQVTRMSGFPVEADAIRSNPFGATVHLENFQVLNPAEFPERDFVQLRLLDIEVKPMSLRTNRIEVPRLHLDLEKIVIVTNRDGTINAKLFSDRLQEAIGPGSDEPLPAYHIRELILRLGRIEWIDHSQGGSQPKTRTVKLGVDKRFADVTDFKTIIAPIVAELAIANADAITNLLPPEYQEKAKGTQQALEGVKKLFDSLRGNGKP